MKHITRKIFFILFIFTMLSSSANAYCIRICFETNSMTEAAKYIQSIQNKMDFDVKNHTNSLHDALSEYNNILKQNVLLQRKWTTYLTAEVLNHKQRINALNKEKALECLYADTYVISIKAKIAKLEVAINNLKAKMNKDNSTQLKAILTNTTNKR